MSATAASTSRPWWPRTSKPSPAQNPAYRPSDPSRDEKPPHKLPTGSKFGSLVSALTLKTKRSLGPTLDIQDPPSAIGPTPPTNTTTTATTASPRARPPLPSSYVQRPTTMSTVGSWDSSEPRTPAEDRTRASGGYQHSIMTLSETDPFAAPSVQLVPSVVGHASDPNRLSSFSSPSINSYGKGATPNLVARMSYASTSSLSHQSHGLRLDPISAHRDSSSRELSPQHYVRTTRLSLSRGLTPDVGRPMQQLLAMEPPEILYPFRRSSLLAPELSGPVVAVETPTPSREDFSIAPPPPPTPSDPSPLLSPLSPHPSSVHSSSESIRTHTRSSSRSSRPTVLTRANSTRLPPTLPPPTSELPPTPVDSMASSMSSIRIAKPELSPGEHSSDDAASVSFVSPSSPLSPAASSSSVWISSVGREDRGLPTADRGKRASNAVDMTQRPPEMQWRSPERSRPLSPPLHEKEYALAKDVFGSAEARKYSRIRSSTNPASNGSQTSTTRSSTPTMRKSASTTSLKSPFGPQFSSYSPGASIGDLSMVSSGSSFAGTAKLVKKQRSFHHGFMPSPRPSTSTSSSSSRPPTAPLPDTPVSPSLSSTSGPSRKQGSNGFASPPPSSTRRRLFSSGTSNYHRHDASVTSYATSEAPEDTYSTTESSYISRGTPSLVLQTDISSVPWTRPAADLSPISFWEEGQDPRALRFPAPLGTSSGSTMAGNPGASARGRGEEEYVEQKIMSHAELIARLEEPAQPRIRNDSFHSLQPPASELAAGAFSERPRTGSSVSAMASVWQTEDWESPPTATPMRFVSSVSDLHERLGSRTETPPSQAVAGSSNGRTSSKTLAARRAQTVRDRFGRLDNRSQSPPRFTSLATAVDQADPGISISTSPTRAHSGVTSLSLTAPNPELHRPSSPPAGPLTALPPPPRTRRPGTIIKSTPNPNRVSIVPLQPLTPPPLRSVQRAKTVAHTYHSRTSSHASLGGIAAVRRSLINGGTIASGAGAGGQKGLMKRPSFLEIGDEIDRDGDAGSEASHAVSNEASSSSEHTWSGALHRPPHAPVRELAEEVPEELVDSFFDFGAGKASFDTMRDSEESALF